MLWRVHRDPSQASCGLLLKVLLHPGHLCYAEQGLSRLIQPDKHGADVLAPEGGDWDRTVPGKWHMPGSDSLPRVQLRGEGWTHRKFRIS